MTLTDSNKILKMEDNDKERLHHEIVQNEFAFCKKFGKGASWRQRKHSPEKRNHRRSHQKF